MTWHYKIQPDQNHRKANRKKCLNHNLSQTDWLYSLAQRLAKELKDEIKTMNYDR